MSTTHRRRIHSRVSGRSTFQRERAQRHTPSSVGRRGRAHPGHRSRTRGRPWLDDGMGRGGPGRERFGPPRVDARGGTSLFGRACAGLPRHVGGERPALHQGWRHDRDLCASCGGHAPRRGCRLGSRVLGPVLEAVKRPRFPDDMDDMRDSLSQTGLGIGLVFDVARRRGGGTRPGTVASRRGRHRAEHADRPPAERPPGRIRGATPGSAGLVHLLTRRTSAPCSVGVAS